MAMTVLIRLVLLDEREHVLRMEDPGRMPDRNPPHIELRGTALRDQAMLVIIDCDAAGETLQRFLELHDRLFPGTYYTGAQLGSTGFNANGEFVARPFDGPIVDDERPLLGSTFLAPGAPRTYWLGAKFSFSGAQKR